MTDSESLTAQIRLDTVILSLRRTARRNAPNSDRDEQSDRAIDLAILLVFGSLATYETALN